MKTYRGGILFRIPLRECGMKTGISAELRMPK